VCVRLLGLEVEVFYRVRVGVMFWLLLVGLVMMLILFAVGGMMRSSWLSIMIISV